jgi:hypothetical protein
MVKRLLSLIVVAAALTLAAVPSGAAQSVTAVSAQRNGEIAATSPGSANPSAMPDAKPTPFCKGCLFYSGDMDPSNANTDGLANELTGFLAQTYSAFTVPSGKPWHVTGVFINTLSTVAILDPSVTQWSILKGVGQGVPGELLFSGTGNATITATGRSFSVFTEYTVSVKLKNSIVLEPGTYFLNVLPQCSNPDDGNCASAEYFWSDVEDASPANHIGPANVIDDSFINASFVDDNFVPSWGTDGACLDVGCDAFSFGLIGKP